MANILRGYGLAREQGYFKLEQEADVQRHRERLRREGKLPAEPQPAEEQQAGAAAAAEGGQRQQEGQQGQGSGRFGDSEHNYEVLAEVLQQQARLDDPNALRKRQFERRVKGEPPQPSEADLLRARSKMYALGAAVGHVPRMSLGRNRWVVGAEGGGGGADLALGARQLSPEAREVASRTYVAGVRALVYGSLLGALGLAAAATYAIRAADIKSGEDLGERMRGSLTPLSVALRGWLVPFKERAEAWLAPTAAAVGGHAGGSGSGSEGGTLGEHTPGSGSGAAAEFSRRLQEKLNTRSRGPGSGGGGGGNGGGEE